MENRIISEAVRLYNKFGEKSIDVIEELIIFDSSNRYFWKSVKNYIETI
jgi:hypothetical protein